MQITEKQLQHLVKFLTHDANYKVTLLDEDGDDYIEHNYNTTIELLDNAKQLIDLYYDGKLTYAKAMECVTHYRYDDDCINEGIEEMWWNYCNENNLVDFYYADEKAWDYDGRRKN
jgi:nucleoside-diphosphate-sugar epimerase